MGALALRPADLREFEGEARVEDLRLGEVLGYENPKRVRDVIRRHRDELLRHGVLTQVASKPRASTGGRSGPVFATVAKTPGKTGGRPERFFVLNEAQAVLVTMFSRTERAADVRTQIVQVFIAWRHGKLAPANEPQRDPLADLVARMELLERTVALHPVRQAQDYPLVLAHLPTGKRHRYPNFWSDLPVREMAVRLHRQMTVIEAICAMQEALGRAPSKSALARFWSWLDHVGGRGFHRKERLNS